MHVTSTGTLDLVYNPTATVQTQQKLDISPETTKTNRLIPLEELKDYSIKAFDCFKTNWVFSKFWIRGNTCHACIGFVASFIKHFPEHPKSDEMRTFIQTMLQQNYDFYDNTDLGPVWNDDCGWWGLMAMDAYQLLKTLKNDDLANKYLDVARECWGWMNDYSYDDSDSAKPVPRGCSNNSKNVPSDGAKNTIVNASLMFLSAKLYGATGENSYRDMAKNQWLWFSQWFELNDGYLKTFGNNAALVGERPLVEGSNYWNKGHPDYNDGWIWTGDHGFLIGGLQELLAIKTVLTPLLDSHFEIKVKEILFKLGHGIKEAMIGNSDGIFHEPPCKSSYNYGNDYLGGPGVLARFIRLIETMKLLGVDFTENIFKTLQAIWSTRNEATNQFKPEYSTDDQKTQYCAQFKKLLGFADSGSWAFNTSEDPNIILAVSQAVGLDFLNAALTAYDN